MEDVTADTLQADGRSDLARILVCSRIVTCAENGHYTIAGADSAEELERAARALRGHCGCGMPLSFSPRRSFCRRCDPAHRGPAEAHLQPATRSRRLPGAPAATRGRRARLSRATRRYGVARALSRLIRQCVSTS
jgi:hypothetical protein